MQGSSFDDSEDRNPIDLIAAEFVERLRHGDTPTVEEYAELHPDLADDILELLPTVVAMERLKLEKEQPEKSRFLKGPTSLERLGDYLILGEIGRGGMGIVYEAEQQSLGRHVAVKVLPRQSLLDGHRLQRFEREAQTAARLHHTNIVPIFGVGEQDGYHYYVMQFIRGLGLDRILRELRGEKPKSSPGTAASSTGLEALARHAVSGLRSGKFATSSGSESRRFSSRGRSPSSPAEDPSPAAGSSPTAPAANGSIPSTTPTPDSETRSLHSPLAKLTKPAAAPDTLGVGREYWRSVARIGVQVADALEYAHSQGTLHRDIKPANLLLDGKGVVWVTDFGLAKAMEDSNVTNSGDVVGTLQYMAPEQFYGEYDARSDVYCLGLTLYELLTLRPAFAGSNRSALMQNVTEGRPAAPRRLTPGIPADLETIVLKAINRDPAHRYQTAEELRADMQRFLEDRPILARRTSPIQHLRRWCRRNRALTAALTVAIVAVLSGTILGWTLYAKERSTSEDLLESKQQFQRTIAKMLQGYAGLITHVTGPDPLQAVVRNSTTDETDSTEAETTQSISIPIVSAREAELLEAILARYAAFHEEIGDHPDLQKETAWAHHKMGEYQVRLGNLEEGSNTYIKAIQKYQDLDEAEFAVPIATIRNQLGQVYAQQKKIAVARKSYLLVVESLEDETGAPRLQDSRALYELALAHDYLGTLGTQSSADREGPRDSGRSRGGSRSGRGAPRGRRRDGGRRSNERRVEFDGPGRDAHHRKAQKLFIELVKREHREPEKLVYHLGLARSDRNYYGFRSMRNDEDRFTTMFLIHEAISTLRALCEEHKGNARAQYCQYELAETLAMLPLHQKEGRDQVKEALGIALALTEENPTIPSYPVLAARIYQRLARYHRNWEMFETEREELESAVTLCEGLVRQWPENLTFLDQLITLRDPYIQRLRRIDPEAAKIHATKAVEEVTRLLEKREAPLEEYRRLSRAYWTLSEVLDDQGLTIEADQAAEMARIAAGEIR